MSREATEEEAGCTRRTSEFFTNPAMQREAPRENSTLNHVRCIFNDGTIRI